MSCKTVLVIEDDPAVRESIQDALEIQGYEIATAADGQEAIQRLNALGTQPCVILLDMMMPGMNGWQFLDYQRNDPAYAGIPVVVCSALAETARSVKPAAFVPKPVELKILVQAVKAFCA
jgi:CheY-like chemotaxis protein